MNIISRIKKYFADMRITDGEIIWGALNKELPPPMGVIEDDKLRIQMFKEKATILTDRQVKALRAFLKSTLEFYMDEPEIISGKEEQIFRRRRQIFSQHIQALNEVSSLRKV